MAGPKDNAGEGNWYVMPVNWDWICTRQVLREPVVMVEGVVEVLLGVTTRERER